MREQARLLSYDTNAYDIFVHGYPFTAIPGHDMMAAGGGAGVFAPVICGSGGLGSFVCHT